MVSATFHRLRVSTVDRICPDAVAVTFAVPVELAEEYAFRPGQWVTLRRDSERRSYSICSDHQLRIGVREVPDGLFSAWLVNDVAPGDTIDVLPPTGTFTADLQAGQHHVLIAAGSGITPVLSITESALACPDSFVTLFYGNRRSDTVMFSEELADLKDRYPARFELVHVLSREAREVELFTGRLDAEKLRSLVSALVDVSDVDHWWLCGPFDMARQARAMLVEFGVPAVRIHQELFYVEDQPPEPVRHTDRVAEGPDALVKIILDGRVTEARLPRDIPILDAAQRSRPDLPFACKGGVCGTCRARLTHGEVRMRRNFALEESEVDSGVVLTCQSIPISDSVTVDFDA